MTTSKSYDYLNRLQQISSAPGASGVSPVTFNYSYNDAGQRTKRTETDASYWVYQYDSLGQVISGKKYWNDGTPVPGQQFEYGFDDIGNRTDVFPIAPSGYALRWDEPSKDPVRTVRGANLLAIAALPFFPVFPTSSTTVVTTGFSGRGSSDTFVTWPIWTGWLALDAVRSLLGLKQLQERHEPSAKFFEMYGAAATYRSQRINPTSKCRNFTPATPL